MKKISGSIGIATFAGIVFFLVIYVTTGNASVAASGAIAPFGFIQIFAQLIESKERDTDYLSGFLIPWKQMTAMCGLILFSAPQVGSLVSSFLAAFSLGPNAYPLPWEIQKTIFIIGTFIVSPIVGFFCGYWLGARCSMNSWVVFAISLVGGLALSKIFDALLTSLIMPDGYERVYHFQGRTLIANLAIGTASMCVVMLPTMLLGFWFGSHNRPAEYMRYLVKALPREKQMALMELMRKAVQSSTI